MTAEYVKSKIEAKAKSLGNTSCLIPYCVKAFSKYFSEDEILQIINNANKSKPPKSYQSFFTLGN